MSFVGWNRGRWGDFLRHELVRNRPSLRACRFGALLHKNGIDHGQNSLALALAGLRQSVWSSPSSAAKWS